MLSKTEYGKAYEYACLMAVYNFLAGRTDRVSIVVSRAYDSAKTAFEKAETEGVAANLTRAANAAVRVIIRLEPQLEYGDGNMALVIQTDAQGIAGDVRDVLCIRADNGWEIGISCKHNHHAVKHSRLSATIDFGKEWFGISCSPKYFQAVVPVFNELRDIRSRAVANRTELPLWSDIANKAERYYIPVLNAFLAELRDLNEKNPNIPGKLINYMLGKYDFYCIGN